MGGPGEQHPHAGLSTQWAQHRQRRPASSHSYDLNSRRCAGNRDIKFKVYRKGATAIVSFSVQLQQLHMPIHYRVLVTGSAVKTRGQ